MRKTEIALTFDSEDKKLIETILKALNPDNANIPNEILFEYIIQEGKILLKVASQQNPETLISTVREVLDNINLCIQTVLVTENGKN
jgi:DNA recombination-dependent growth factor C